MQWGLAGPGEVEHGGKCIDLSAFIDTDGLVVWGGENPRGGFWGGEVGHASPVGDFWRNRMGTLSKGEVDEVDSGRAEEDVRGLDIGLTPAEGVELSKPGGDVGGGAKDAVALCG